MSPMHVNALLDRIVDKSNRIYRNGRRVVPYAAAHQAGKMLSLVLVAWFALFSGDPRMWRFYIAFIPIVRVYQMLYVNRIKPLLFKTANQSFLQDSVLFLVPCMIVMLWLLRVPVGPGLDLFGLILPLMLGFRRIGCFLGGCCFGLPSRIGVLYPEHVLGEFSEERRNNPLFVPTERVFPIQLVESLVGFVLFAGLLVRLWVTRDFSGLTMLWFFWLYSAWRFVGDFFRVSSGRPRYFGGRFSEAQVFSLILLFACAALHGAIA